MKRTILLLATWSVLMQGITQQMDRVMVLARAGKEGIKLRWAPSKSTIWELANKYGYTVERYTLMRDSVPTSGAPYEVLMYPVVRPAVEAIWEPLIDEDDYAAIAAQAIYGETFELTDSFDKDIFQVAQKTEERDHRYSFTLFAADQSFRVATLSGLAFTDAEVKKDEKYLYRIYANIPPSILSVDTALAFIGLSDSPPLPKIQNFRATFGDRQALLAWEKGVTEKFYNAFWIEKSVDGGDTFISITDKPIINAYSDEKAESNTFYKIDTLALDEAEVQYRIKGVNPFGEEGPWSAIVSGRAAKSVKAYAGITSRKLHHDGSATIYWKFPETQEAEIDGFAIRRVRKIKGPSERVNRQIINKTLREYRMDSIQGTAYYSVGLVVKGREMNFSVPEMVQAEDSIPPLPPKNLTASANYQGLVNLSWSDNEESDLWGYRIFRSNFRSAEFSEITSEPLASSYFTDSIAINNLTEKVYYQVVAIDKRDNRSQPSEIFELRKPDIIPPAPPVFARAEASEEGAFLEWVPSNSADVTNHLLYRKVKGASQWELIAKLDTPYFYIDKDVLEGENRYYTLVAVDDAGLESPPAKPVRAARKKTMKTVDYGNFFGRSERENKRIALFWKADTENTSAIKIYRARGKEAMSLYHKTQGNPGNYQDRLVVQNETYSYQLQAVLKNGMETSFSKIINVKY